MNLSSSMIGRALACPASLHLPQVIEAPGEPAIRGTWVHRYLQLRVTGVEHTDAVATLFREGCPDEYVEQVSAIDFTLPPTTGDGDPQPWRAESSFALNCATMECRHLGDDLGRSYGKLEPFEVAVTTDATRIVGRYGYVLDWKTGRDLGDPATSAQLRTGAAALMARHGLSVVRVAFGYVRESGLWITPWAEIDLLDVHLFTEELRDLHVHSAAVAATIAQGQTPDVRLGGHCDYCPAAYSCPAQTALVRSLPDMGDETSITRSQMGAAWEKIRVARKMLARLERQIRAEAGREPIPLPGGGFLGPTTTEGNEQLDGRIAHAAIAEVTGDYAVADAAVSMAVTKASIDRSLEAAYPNPKERAKKKKLILAQIRATGGARKPTKTDIAEYGK